MCALSLDDYCIIFIVVLKCMYNGNSAHSTPFPLNNGVKQGGVLSPILFSMYIDSLLEKLRVRFRLSCRAALLQVHSPMRMILLLFPHLSVGYVR